MKVLNCISIVAIVAIFLIGDYSPAKGYDNQQDRSKVIIFSHKFHAEEVGTECLDCHVNVESSMTAESNLLPIMAQCYTCHDEDDTDCEYCHVTEEYVEFINPPREIKFNHSLHLEDSNLECIICHKGINEVDYSAAEQLPEMTQCMECHNDESASSECAICHSETNIALLKPSTHLADWSRSHALDARFNTNDCSMCHQESFCQDCHDVDQLVLVGGELSDSYSPNETTSGGSVGQALNRVHQLDYRFTHSFDAKGKFSDCAVCHESNEFCTTCHNPEDDDHRFEPAWHGGVDWVSLNARHGEMARRDMELCASCHDLDGEDPVCLQCHMDITFGPNNDTKTHELGFMNDVKGEWHSDQNYLCYNCHTIGTFSSGIGFCGYCHGDIGD